MQGGGNSKVNHLLKRLFKQLKQIIYICAYVYIVMFI